MRKFLTVLMVLCLAALPCLAEGTETIDYDFGHFTLTLPADIMGEMADEISANQMFFMLYPDFDEAASFHPNINGVWGKDHADLTKVDPQEMGETIVQMAFQGFEQAGLDATNPTLIQAELGEVGGKPALIVTYSADVDYASLGLDFSCTLYAIQMLISDEAFGTYTFTLSTDDLENSASLTDIMDTLVWKE